MAVPTKDSLLVSFGTNFSTRITASPTTFDLLAADATQYATLLGAFTAAYTAVTTARDAGNRSQSLTSAKDAAKVSFLAFARDLYGRVQSNMTISDADKNLLGVNVRSEPTPIPAPAMPPVVEVVSVNQNIVQISMHGSGTTKRGLPDGVDGAVVISWVGENPPADPMLWRTEGVVSRGKLALAFPLEAEPFSKVYIATAWFSPSKETGPMCVPVSTYLGSWVVENAANNTSDTQQLKAA